MLGQSIRAACQEQQGLIRQSGLMSLSIGQDCRCFCWKRPAAGLHLKPPIVWQLAADAEQEF